MRFCKSSQAQGTIEYLIIIGIIVVISLVVVAIVLGNVDSTSNTSQTSSTIFNSIGSGGISVTEAISDYEGTGLINLSNYSGEARSLTKIITDEGENEYNDKLIGDDGIDISGLCNCEEGMKNKTCNFKFYFKETLDPTNLQVTIKCEDDFEPKEPPTLPTDCFKINHNPIKICSLNDLNRIREKLEGNYILMKDIDASETSTWNDGNGFAPIGSSSTLKFTGSFDGQNKKIYYLYINQPVTNYIGLFGYSAGTISNTELIDASIIGKNYVGALAGYSKGPVSNSYSIGNITGSGWVGGLIGYSSGGASNGSISNSFSTGSVTGGSTTGGLVGYSTGPISNSYSNANVSGTYNIGGLIGSSSGIVTNTYSTGSVNGTSSVGGLIGIFSGYVKNSYTTGNVIDITTSGGAIGYCSTTGGTYSNIWWFNSKSSCRYIGPYDYCTSVNTCTKASSANDFFDTTQDVYDYNIPYWDFGTDANWIERDNNYPILSWQND